MGADDNKTSSKSFLFLNMKRSTAPQVSARTCIKCLFPYNQINHGECPRCRGKGDEEVRLRRAMASFCLDDCPAWLKNKRGERVSLPCNNSEIDAVHHSSRLRGDHPDIFKCCSRHVSKEGKMVTYCAERYEANDGDYFYCEGCQRDVSVCFRGVEPEERSFLWLQHNEASIKVLLLSNDLEVPEDFDLLSAPTEDISRVVDQFHQRENEMFKTCLSCGDKAHTPCMVGPACVECFNASLKFEKCMVCSETFLSATLEDGIDCLKCASSVVCFSEECRSQVTGFCERCGGYFHPNCSGAPQGVCKYCARRDSIKKIKTQ